MFFISPLSLRMLQRFLFFTFVAFWVPSHRLSSRFDFCDHRITVISRWVQPGTLTVIYLSLTWFNKNDIDNLAGQLTKFNLLPGARGCRGPRSNRIGGDFSWMMILPQRDLCWTNRWYSYTVNMRDGENWDNGFKACLFVTAPRPTLELAN